MSACLLQMFVNKLNDYEPGLVENFVAPDVQAHLDRLDAEEQEKQEYILHMKYIDLHAILDQDCGGRRSREPDAWIHEQMVLENMIQEVIEDMVMRDITPYDLYSATFEIDFYARYPYNEWNEKCPPSDVWNGNYPPRFDF